MVTARLRTTECERARDFYAAVLGRDDAVIVELRAQALSRGARPHWLGFIDVAELEPTLSAFVARGAQQLGPSLRSVEGEVAVVRDPGGAVVALAAALAPSAGPEVVWYQLNTADVARAKLVYGELFGWHCSEPEVVAAAGVVNHPFAWRAGEVPVGAMADVAGRPSVHPHWLFHFAVAGLDLALEKARALGAVTLPVLTLPGGARVAVCDDPQGAAFALLERLRP
jgi:predicted enzyme related to lactoylglutathione lyase